MNQIKENGKKVHSFYSKCLIYGINGRHAIDMTYGKRDKGYWYNLRSFCQTSI